MWSLKKQLFSLQSGRPPKHPVPTPSSPSSSRTSSPLDGSMHGSEPKNGVTPHDDIEIMGADDYVSSVSWVLGGLITLYPV